MSRVVKIRSEDPAYWLERGQRARYARDFDEAERCLDEALRLAPQDPIIINTRARLHMQCHRSRAALALLEQACAFHPGLPELWNNRGIALSRLERYDEALLAIDRALELDPDEPDILENRAMVLLHRGQARQALADLSRVVTSQPHEPHPWHRKALVHVHLRQLRQARHAFLHSGRRLWAEGGSKRVALVQVAVGSALGLLLRLGVTEPDPARTPAQPEPD